MLEDPLVKLARAGEKCYLINQDRNEILRDVKMSGVFVSSCGPKEGRWVSLNDMHHLQAIYLLEVYLVTALVPSDTACLASSPGRIRRTAVWISREEIVDRLLYWASRDASTAMRSKTSFTNEFMMDIAFDETPVSGCTCFSTR
ncbi:hypothetical protein ANCDUO_07469 [Ancylostoma duodenale]|uniref:Uncharacterized protein n=1 Tax=Ancylostoma duodenale TaxID=51022 RepID=A0A0C2GYP0_9BILA|nr:hypothetical protein ANCDUO_07469 [Ancylostoma duodenale]